VLFRSRRGHGMAATSVGSIMPFCHVMDDEFDDKKNVYTCSNDMSLGRSLQLINDSKWVAKPGMGESHLEADTTNMIGKR
jgi:hypothetical protein